VEICWTRSLLWTVTVCEAVRSFFFPTLLESGAHGRALLAMGMAKTAPPRRSDAGAKVMARRGYAIPPPVSRYLPLWSPKTHHGLDDSIIFLLISTCDGVQVQARGTARMITKVCIMIQFGAASDLTQN
jgi:hypothetical protein